eukprot:15432676-Alexandrium_andersonii.AAC.1
MGFAGLSAVVMIDVVLVAACWVTMVSTAVADPWLSRAAPVWDPNVSSVHSLLKLTNVVVEHRIGV